MTVKDQIFLYCLLLYENQDQQLVTLLPEERSKIIQKEAKRYDRVSFTEALTKRLQVMDSTAFSLCMDNKIPILVFDMHQPTNVRDAVLGKQVGSLVTD